MFGAIGRKVREILDLVNALHATLSADSAGKLAGVSLAHHRDWMLATHPRYRDQRCLTPHGYGVYSQTDSDGILAELFRRIGVSTSTFVEIGVEDGTETNTTALLQAGWSGTWIEGNPAHCGRMRHLFANPIGSHRLTLREGFATTDNVAKFLAECRVPAEPDLLVIDTDGNDYWLWKALAGYRPRIVVVEYNADFGPVLEWVKPYDADHVFAGTRYYGASLKSYELLGRELGYVLVGCNWFGHDAFFVRSDIEGGQFLPPFTSEAHYEPPRHQWRTGGAWPKDDREFQRLQR